MLREVLRVLTPLQHSSPSHSVVLAFLSEMQSSRTDCVVMCCQDHKLLLTLGRDDAVVSLKVWNLEAWAKTAKAPPLLRTIDCFGGKSPEADVSQLAVHEGTWPFVTYAVGLANGHLYVLQADTGMEAQAY